MLRLKNHNYTLMTVFFPAVSLMHKFKRKGGKLSGSLRRIAPG